MQKYYLKLSPSGAEFINKPYRNSKGRITSSFYKEVIIIYCLQNGKYIPDEFKKFILSLNILSNNDLELMTTRQYPEWKHYIDAAKQQLLENQIIIEDISGNFLLEENYISNLTTEYIKYFDLIPS